MYRLYYSIEMLTCDRINGEKDAETIQELIQFWNEVVDTVGDRAYFGEILQSCSDEDLLKFCRATGEECIA